MADNKSLTAALLLSLLVVYSDALTTSRQQPHSPTHWFRVFLHDVFPTEENKPSPAGASMTSPDPPPHTEHARMARYILHQSEWTSMATLSTRAPGYPTANVFSVSDGPVNNSSGTPYFYLSAWELSVHDLMKNNRASLTMSLAQGNYCTANDIDPEDPTCAHVILSGKVVFLKPEDSEASFAKEALFTRHPAMEGWPEGHEWSFAKLDIEDIMLLDFYGGVKHVNIEDYYNATPY